MRRTLKRKTRLWLPGARLLIASLLLVLAPYSTLSGEGNSTPFDPASLEVFIDKSLPPRMDASHVLGAAVSVVQGGKVLFSKGYGYTDVDKQVPVRADQTVFRIGSISKVITWTAVMQLVEQGRLDLNKDVNEYLDFQIPETFKEPITMNHLMAHTGLPPI